MKARVILVAAVFLASLGLGSAVAVSIRRINLGQDSPLGSADAPPLGWATPGWGPVPDATITAVQRPLDKDEIATAMELASRSGPVLQVLRGDGSKAKVASVGLFTEPGVRVGAAVTFELIEPYDIDLVLPAVDEAATDNAAIQRGYGLAEMRRKIKGLRKFVVFIDLHSHDVAGIMPLDYVASDESVAVLQPITAR